MGFNEIRIVEERCDRCKLLISTQHINHGDDDFQRKEENAGRFILEINDVCMIKYEVLCDKCKKRLNALLDEMGPVNRGVRGRKPKKSQPENQATAEDVKKVKKSKK